MHIIDQVLLLMVYLAVFVYCQHGGGGGSGGGGKYVYLLSLLQISNCIPIDIQSL